MPYWMPQVIKKLQHKKNRIIPIIIFGIYTVFLFSVTLIPTDVIPSEGKSWFSKISIENGDKAVHFALFFIFTLLYFYSKLYRNYPNLILIPISTGVLIEILQHLLNGGRTFDWFDILANVLGTFFAYFLIRKFLITQKS